MGSSGGGQPSNNPNVTAVGNIFPVGQGSKPPSMTGKTALQPINIPAVGFGDEVVKAAGNYGGFDASTDFNNFLGNKTGTMPTFDVAGYLGKMLGTKPSQALPGYDVAKGINQFGGLKTTNIPGITGDLSKPGFDVAGAMKQYVGYDPKNPISPYEQQSVLAPAVNRAQQDIAAQAAQRAIQGGMSSVPQGAMDNWAGNENAKARLNAEAAVRSQMAGEAFNRAQTVTGMRQGQVNQDIVNRINAAGMTAQNNQQESVNSLNAANMGMNSLNSQIQAALNAAGLGSNAFQNAIASALGITQLEGQKASEMYQGRVNAANIGSTANFASAQDWMARLWDKANQEELIRANALGLNGQYEWGNVNRAQNALTTFIKNYNKQR